MTDVREILGRALPEHRPVGVTRDTAIAAGRRVVRRRRMWAAAASASLALFVVIGVATMVAPPWGRGPQNAASPSATISSSPDESPSPTPPPTDLPTTTPDPDDTSVAFPGPEKPLTEPTSAAMTRLATVLEYAVMQQLPTGFTFRPATVYFTSGTRTLQPFQWIDFPGRYQSFMEIRDALGAGQFELTISPNNGQERPTRPFGRFCETTSELVTGCQAIIGPNGEHITVEWGGPSLSSRITEIRVEVFKPDGTSVLAVARNFADSSGQDLNMADPHRPEPPLTAEQIIMILLSPGMTLYP